jgi:hypothetical protein
MTHARHNDNMNEQTGLIVAGGGRPVLSVDLDSQTAQAQHHQHDDRKTVLLALHVKI